MTDPSVRKTKRADELVVGDWFASATTDDVPTEVLAVIPFETNLEGPYVLAIFRSPSGRPESWELDLDTVLTLATAEDLAEQRAAGERVQRIADIRALADWLEANPWLPIADLDVNRHLYGPDGYRTVVETAERLGATLDKHLDDRTKFTFRKSPLRYTLLAWHEDGRPVEPEAVAEATAVAEAQQFVDAIHEVTGHFQKAFAEGPAEDMTVTPRFVAEDLREIVHWRTSDLLDLTIACGNQSGPYTKHLNGVTCQDCLAAAGLGGLVDEGPTVACHTCGGAAKVVDGDLVHVGEHGQMVLPAHPHDAWVG